MATKLDEFRRKIEDLRQIAANQRYYIDPKALRGLCNHELVLGVVREIGVPRHSREKCVKTIIAVGFVTLSILVCIREEKLIMKFLESDVFNRLDDRLPMDMNDLDKIAPAPGQLKKFEEYQWQFTPVILERHEHKIYQDKFILPFKEDVRRSDCDGSFGHIYSVTIEAPMQRLLTPPSMEVYSTSLSPSTCSSLTSEQSSTSIKVIRKQLIFSGDKKSFDKEREVLRLLQQIKHPNIADLLCSYTYKQEHSLIFELEDMDLSEFLKLDHRYKDFESNTTFFTAFYGLASALETVHNCSLEDGDDSFTVVGYHHDIRPQNILVRANDFVLTDFGLAKMSEDDASSGTPYKAGFGEYAAPECLDDIFIHQHVGRTIDIWSLGAMMVDIASFIEGGAEGKNESVRMRKEEGPPPLKSNTRFHAHGNLKTGVKKHIQSLESNPEDKTLRTFLSLSVIMLVSQDNRPDASTVRRNASYIAIKSLFRAALTGMAKFRQQSSAKTPDKNWHDLCGLCAWGEVIDLNGAHLVTEEFAYAIKDGLKSEQVLQKTLLKLVKLFGYEPFHDSKNTEEGSDDMSSPQSPYVHKKVDKITKLVSELKRELPTSYQHKVDRRKVQMMTERDATEVPNLSDETLQSSAYPELVLEPAVNTPLGMLKMHQSSVFINSGEFAEQKEATSATRSTISQKTPNSVSDIKPITETSSSISDSLSTYHSYVTTPDLADGRNPTELARSDLLLRKSLQPNLTYSKASTQRRKSDEAHGRILPGTDIIATL